MEETIEKQMALLGQQLREYQRLYYVESRPAVSDLEYDRLFDQLVRLEKEHPEFASPDSPTQRVGSDLTSDFPEVEHSIPVLSLDKAYSAQEVLSWIDRKKDDSLSFVIEQKIDGISMVLYYEHGMLKRAVTRGNGFVGNDVTANIRTIGSVPLRLQEDVDIVVRGEVYLPIKDFDRLNDEMEVPYANPRNLAAGTVRRQKSSEAAQVPLDIFIYEGFWMDGRPFNSHIEILTELKRLGFRTNPSIGYFSRKGTDPGIGCAYGTFDDIPKYIEKQTEGRPHLGYEIDGLVTKINEIDIREKLGYTGHHPRWAIAYKFESPQAASVVQAIDVQVGRTGRITPVARIKPVFIGGSTVSNVTLHNQQYINELELAVGDTVEVSKRGDVIPAVERVIDKNEMGNSTYVMPSECPSCHSHLEYRGAHLFCLNEECPDKIRARVGFFVGKAQMDIESLGPETVAYLIDKGLLHDVQDIYTIDYTQLCGEPGFGEKKVRGLIDGVNESRKQDFSRVLVSLGIPEFGKKAVDLLIKDGIDSMDKLLDIAEKDDVERLVSIKHVGEKTARLLIDALRDERMTERIHRLAEAGLKMAQEEKCDNDIDQIFSGQVWCVTGSFEHYNPRSLAMEEVEKRGGRTVSSVTSKTTHLLAGKGAGSKLKKAQELGTVIVDENEFLNMISDGAEESGSGPLQPELF